MASPEPAELLDRLGAGDRGAEDELEGVVYDELHALARRLMRGERRGHTLQATALVHETWLRLAGERDPAAPIRGPYLRVAAGAMRRVLVDHARHRGAQKRGGGLERTPLDELVAQFESPDATLLELDEALAGLEAVDGELVRIVELRYFGGLTAEETAAALGTSRSSVMRGWETARAWLARTLDPEAR